MIMYFTTTDLARTSKTDHVITSFLLHSIYQYYHTSHSFIIIMFSRSTVSAIRSLTSSSSQARWTTAATTSYAISNIATSHSSHNTLLNNHQYRCLNVASRPSELIGNTPLLDLNKILVAHGVDGKKIAITNIHIPPDI